MTMVYTRGPVLIEDCFLPDHDMDMAHILDHMRDCDRHEFTSVGANPSDAAPRLISSSDSYLARLHQEPVFIWGAYRRFPHVMDIFGFGTDLTPRTMPALTRWGTTQWLPGVFEDGSLQRIEVRVPASCTHSIKWLTEGLGLAIECTLPGYSLFGEPYFQLALSRERYVHLQQPRPATDGTGSGGTD